MRLLHKAPRAVQTQAVNLIHIGRSRSSRVISHGDIPTHRYNTASRAVAFLLLRLRSIFIQHLDAIAQKGVYSLIYAV